MGRRVKKAAFKFRPFSRKQKKILTAIIADISKRLVKTGEITETSRRQAEILQGAGLLYKDVLKRVSQVSGYMNAELIWIQGKSNY